MRWHSILLILGLLVSLGLGPWGCTDSKSNDTGTPSGGPAESTSAENEKTTSNTQLRNQAILHALRDTPEGYLEASRIFRTIAEKNPDDLTDWTNLLKCLAFVDPEHASSGPEVIAKTWAILGEAAPPVELSYTTGLVYVKLGDFEKALPHLEAALESCQDGGASAGARSPQVWYQCGRAQEETKALEKAEATYNELVQLWPTFRPAFYRLTRVLVRLRRMDELGPVNEKFQALPEDKSLEQAKCTISQVTRKPLRREPHEPKAVTISWTDITAKTFTPAVSNARFALPIDLERDGQAELLVLGPESKIHRFEGGRASGSTAIAAANDARFACCGDLDNDGFPDLILGGSSWSLLQGQDPAAGASFTPRPLASTPPADWIDCGLFDLDHDGDLDWIGTASNGPWMLRNNGGDEIAFSPHDPFPDADGIAPGSRFDVHDLDQANDLDLVVSRADGGVLAFLNLRDDKFEAVPLPEFGQHTQVMVEDFDNDGAPDVFATGGNGWTFARNLDAQGAPYRFRATRVPPASTWNPGHVVTAAATGDIDNDGDFDVVLAGNFGIAVAQNHKAGEFQLSAPTPLPQGQKVSQLHLVELTGDELLDLVIVTEQGSVLLWRNETPGYRRLHLVARGRSDNKDSIGAVVELFAERNYQVGMIKKQVGLHLGVGKPERTGLDGIALRWPQGIRQALPVSELPVAPTGVSEFLQKEGLISSCPFLYGYGPDGWQFLTDVIGIAPLDEWLPPGQSPALDPEEFVRIPGSALEIVDGRVRLAVTEELRETAYVDRLELCFVDHPADLEAYLDESTRRGRYDSLQLQLVEKGTAVPLHKITLADGTDVSALAAQVDGQYLHGYTERRTQWGGWVDPYTFDMVLAKPATSLLFSGRIAWFNSTVVYSLWQHGRTWQNPKLEIVQADGSTTPLVANVGLPAGMDRTLVCTFPRLEAGTTIRFTGQHRFLWDRILSTPAVTTHPIESFPHEAPNGVQARVTPVVSAVLGHHGYSATRGDRGRHEQGYDYRETAPDDSFGRTVGLATRYGNVQPLLTNHDDQLVVLVAGDGMEVEFEVPPISQGTRTYFLRVSGWAKEDGYHVKTGHTIGPLPVRGMKQYPPKPSEIPSTDSYRAYLDEYQTRNVRY